MYEEAFLFDGLSVGEILLLEHLIREEAPNLQFLINGAGQAATAMVAGVTHQVNWIVHLFNQERIKKAGVLALINDLDKPPKKKKSGR